MKLYRLNESEDFDDEQSQSTPSSKEDKKKAKEWYKKACDNRIQEGCEYYKDLNQKGY